MLRQQVFGQPGREMLAHHGGTDGTEPWIRAGDITENHRVAVRSGLLGHDRVAYLGYVAQGSQGLDVTGRRASA